MMKRTLSSLIAIGLALPSLTNAQDVPPEGFVALFNGKDLSGWFGHGTKDPRTLWKMSPDELAAHKKSTLEDINAHWSVTEDGILHNDGQGLYLTTDRDYRDFDLRLEYKTVARADSGIYLRGVPQVQIWDPTEEGKFKHGADKGSGGLWNNKAGSPGKDPLVLADKPFGEWNSMRIVMVGEKVSVWLNDKLVVDHAAMNNYFEKKSGVPIFARGPIQLQTHGGVIDWRNIYINELDAAEATAILNEKAGTEGFIDLFDGLTLDGWIGATDQYEVVDGSIRCKKGAGGNLLHEKKYGDFHLEFEFKLPPGGNNGIAVRTPSAKANPAYAGLEVQVLDDTHPKYAKLKDYQFHGSVYTLAPAHKGFLRPVGEWNHEEIIYKGSHIQVILNGTKILDADLSKVDNEKGNHQGKKRARGFIGFAGHNDPVEFRAIQMKEL